MFEVFSCNLTENEKQGIILKGDQSKRVSQQVNKREHDIHTIRILVSSMSQAGSS